MQYRILYDFYLNSMLMIPKNCGQEDGGIQIDTISFYLCNIIFNYYILGISCSSSYYLLILFYNDISVGK